MEAWILEGGTAPPPRWLGVVWSAGVGYVLGIVALVHILREPSLEPNGFSGLLLLGIAPALLSALGALLGAQARSVPAAILLTMLGSLIASLLCAPATWGLFMLEHYPSGPFGHTPGNALAITAVVTVIGAFIAAPLGVVFGVVFSVAIALLVSLRRRASRGSLDAALVGLGLGWVIVGAGVVTLLATSDVGSLFEPHLPRAHEVELLALAGGLATLGLGLTVAGAARWIARAWLTERIRDDELPGWALVPAAAVRGAKDLPRLFPLGRCDGVIIRRERTCEGPYRSGEPATSVARVAL